MTRIEDIEAREKAATAGPWYTELVTITSTGLQATNVCARGDSHWRSGGRTLTEIGHWRDRVDPEADAKFIAHAREDIPYLLAELRDREAKLEAVEEYSTFLKSDKAKHLKGAVGIALNIGVLLKGGK